MQCNQVTSHTNAVLTSHCDKKVLKSLSKDYSKIYRSKFNEPFSAAFEISENLIHINHGNACGSRIFHRKVICDHRRESKTSCAGDGVVRGENCDNFARPSSRIHLYIYIYVYIDWKRVSWRAYNDSLYSAMPITRAYIYIYTRARQSGKYVLNVRAPHTHIYAWAAYYIYFTHTL